MSEITVFDKIVDGSLPAFKVWEDANYLAFLTPWPSTPGFTVVIPKKNPGENYIKVADESYLGLLLASKKVAAILKKAFKLERVGLVIEGEGVPYLHVKLIPMHGLGAAHVVHQEFYPTYPGYLSTAPGPLMSDEDLKAIQAKIQKAAQ
jgi:diadenosine tetraphosphate (Ap4A) HIT family hydrolase